MNEKTARFNEKDEDIDFRILLRMLWVGKNIIVGITLFSAVLSVGISLYLPNIYASSALLSPKKSDGGGGALSQLSAQYGGIASMAGINIGSLTAGTDTVVAIETIKSRHFFGEYLYKHILIDLMAVEAWEPGSNKVVIDPRIYDIKVGQWVRDIDSPRTKKPSIQEAFVEFLDLLTVSEDKLTGLVTITVEHYSPMVAKVWVDLMINGVNEAIRSRAIAEASRAIDYLNEQREKTVLVNLDEVFAQLIEQQTKTIMLAHVSNDYVFQVIEPPVVSELKAKPHRAFICILGTMLGGVLSVLFVFIRDRASERL